MAVLVRSWNVFHGRTMPPGRRGYLRDVIELAIEGSPEIVCLQEVPLWGVDELAGWSGMGVAAVRTRRALPLPFDGARRVTDLDHGRLRSFLSGQANTVLVGPRLKVVTHARLVLNDPAFRRRFAAEHGLGRRDALAWGREPRVAQSVRVVDVDGLALVVVNLHASHLRDGRLADAEILRAAAHAEDLADPGDPVVVAGDFNRRHGTDAIAELERRGYSPAGPGIDHVLVRGSPVSELVVWPEERRRRDGRLLSDHPPVELTVG